MMHERLAYRAFRAAGVPASRSNHAAIFLNGEYYGLHANVESVDKRMLARWFDDAEGTLFEGGDVDFYPQFLEVFEHESGPEDRTLLAALIDALQLQPVADAYAAASAYLDMANWQRFWAVTIVVGQFDAYPYHFDDFHLYSDPDTGLFAFIPWGTDESFDAVSNPKAFLGKVAFTCALTVACVEGLGASLEESLTSLESSDFAGEVDSIAQQIDAYVTADQRKPYTNLQVDTAREGLREFIVTRRPTLAEQLSPDEEP
jgi:hypothetical protein